MRLADGRLTPIENLRPGDLVASLRVPGLEVDVPYRAQYRWLSRHGLSGADAVIGRVASIKLGEHDGFVVINRRIKATPEHPFMVRRGAEPNSSRWGFASAEFVVPGDYLVSQDRLEELVQSVDRIEAPARTVAVHIPGTNTFCAEGVWVHNDLPVHATQSSGSGGVSSASGSGSGSGSGSEEESSSGDGSSGNKSSGSSFASSGSSSGGSSGTMGSSGIGPGGSGTLVSYSGGSTIDDE